MEGPSYHPPPPQPVAANNPVTVGVISPHFCLPYQVDLRITEKMVSLKETDFTVTDTTGRTLFTIKGAWFSFRDRCNLKDAQGKTLISFKQKILTAHRRWQAFRGNSSKSEDLLFSVKKSSMLQLRTKLDVFLAANTSEDVPDFRIDGSYHERSCTIYAGNAVIAEMHKQISAESIIFGKDTFGVKVYPTVDYAFIVSLVVILANINEDRTDFD